jgi:formylglycine-generating enzyme required for sulfatase activity
MQRQKGDEDPLQDHANFAGFQAGTTKVGDFQSGASPYGCLDMAGNVSEWCLDTYDPEFYKVMLAHDPCQTGTGQKVLRGGSWRSEMAHIRCANRYYYSPERCSYGVGFRVVRLENLAK